MATALSALAPVLLGAALKGGGATQKTNVSQDTNTNVGVTASPSVVIGGGVGSGGSGAPVSGTITPASQVQSDAQTPTSSLFPSIGGIPSTLPSPTNTLPNIPLQSSLFSGNNSILLLGAAAIAFILLTGKK